MDSMEPIEPEFDNILNPGEILTQVFTEEAFDFNEIFFNFIRYVWHTPIIQGSINCGFTVQFLFQVTC